MNPLAINPWVLIVAGLVWIASLGAVGSWQRHDGAAVERTGWQSKENEELRKKNARIVELENKAKADQASHGLALDSIASNYERKLSNANEQRKKDVAAVLAGSIRLRDPGAASLRPVSGGICPPVAGASLSDGRSTGELSPTAAGFLLNLTNDADDVARQLAEAQAVILEDRRLCGIKQ